MSGRTLTAIAIVSLACGQTPVAVEPAPSQIPAETATTAASQPAAETAALRLVASLQANSEEKYSNVAVLAESLDGKLLAWGYPNGMVCVHSFEDGKTSTVLDLSHMETLSRRVKDIAFDEEGRLWWRDATSGVFCADISGKEPRIDRVMALQGYNVISSNLLPWGVVTDEEKFIRLRLKTYLKLTIIDSEKGYTSDVVFPDLRPGGAVNELIQRAVRSPDGKYLMAVADGDAALLNLPDMKIIRRFGQGWGESAAFSPSSKLVAMGTYCRGIFVWETETGNLVKHIPLKRSDVVQSLVFVGEDTLYANTHPVSRIDIKSGAVEAVADIRQMNAVRLLLSRSGDRLFIGMHGGAVEVYALPPKDVLPKEAVAEK